MKIVILSDSFDYSNSSDHVARSMAEALQKKGHEISVITSTQNRAAAGKVESNGITVWSVYSDYNLFWRSYVSLYNYQTIGNIRKILNELKPDIVHAHNIHIYLSYHALKIAKQIGAKVFLTAHDVMLFHYGKLTEFIDSKDLTIMEKFNYKINIWHQIRKAGKTYNPLRNVIIRYYLKYVDKIFAVSDALKRVLNDNSINNVEVVHNGIDLNDWQSNDNDVENFKKQYNLLDKKIIFFGGRLSVFKGVEKIIAAMRFIIKEFPNTILLMAGSINEESEKILNAAKEAGIRDSVIATGWLSGKMLKAAYFTSDVIAVPSISFDSFPTINLEAMAANKPVVGTCFGGTPEIVINNETGYIVNPYNEKELAEKIIDLLKNPEKATTFGKAGREIVEKIFGIENQIEKTLFWYKKFL